MKDETMKPNELKQMKLGALEYRTAIIKRADVSAESRTVPVVFSTETPVLTYFGYEILDHNPGSVRMDRMNNNAPVLKDHDTCNHIGAVSDPMIMAAEKVGRANLRFAQNPMAEIEFKDIMDGIRDKVSVGYMRHAAIPEVGQDNKQVLIDGIPVYRTIDWEPYEISTVAVEADVNTGVGRELVIPDGTIEQIVKRVAEINETNNKLKEKQTMSETAATPAPVNESEIRSNEMKRINGIDAMAKFAAHVPNIVEIRTKAVNDNWSVERFSNEVLPLMSTRSTEIKPDQNAAQVMGIDGKDLRGFRLSNAIRQLANNKVLSGKEKEISDHINAFMKRGAKEMTVTVPASFLFAKRDLNATTAASGGYVVATDTLTSELIELQRNKTVVEEAGARLLTGLVGNVAIPKQSGGATAYWLAEGATGSLSDQAFGQVALSPKRLFGATAFTKQLMEQTSLGVESFIVGDIQKQLKIAKDLAALSGTGADGQPAGVLTLSGLATSVTFGAAATFAKMIEFETNVATNNADLGSLAYITTPATRGKLKAKSKDANGSAGFVWEDGMVNGYPAFATNQMSSGLVVFGNWNDLVIGEWAGVDITVDPYTLAADGKIRIIIELHCDIVARHAGSFCKSTDSGAQ